MHLKFAFHQESKLGPATGRGRCRGGGVATNVCACVAVAFAIASSCGNLQFSAWSRGAKVCGQCRGEGARGGQGSCGQAVVAGPVHTARHSQWASIRCVCVINVLNVGVSNLLPACLLSQEMCAVLANPSPSSPLLPRALFLRFGLRLCRALV